MTCVPIRSDIRPPPSSPGHIYGPAIRAECGDEGEGKGPRWNQREAIYTSRYCPGPFEPSLLGVFVGEWLLVGGFPFADASPTVQPLHRESIVDHVDNVKTLDDDAVKDVGDFSTDTIVALLLIFVL